MSFCLPDQRLTYRPHRLTQRSSRQCSSSMLKQQVQPHLGPTEVRFSKITLLRSRSGLTMPLCRQSVGAYQETRSHATRPQSSQLAEPLWTDPGLKSGISVHDLISTLKKKNRRREMNCCTFFQKSSHARKKPSPPPPLNSRSSLRET